MMCRRYSIFIPCFGACRVFAGNLEGCSIGSQIFFTKGAMNTEVSSYRGTVYTGPLVSVTQFNIGIIFNTGNTGVEYIIV